MSGTATIYCAAGCCPGCRDCYGMGIGCHQDPCRCDRSCTCRWADEDTDRAWRGGCERHDDTGDLRFVIIEPDNDEVADVWPDAEPCPECGSLGACSYDAEGRPLIHALHATQENDQ